jgi:hypothetical protein
MELNFAVCFENEHWLAIMRDGWTWSGELPMKNFRWFLDVCASRHTLIGLSIKLALPSVHAIIKSPQKQPSVIIPHSRDNSPCEVYTIHVGLCGKEISYFRWILHVIHSIGLSRGEQMRLDDAQIRHEAIYWTHTEPLVTRSVKPFLELQRPPCWCAFSFCAYNTVRLNRASVSCCYVTSIKTRYTCAKLYCWWRNGPMARDWDKWHHQTSQAVHLSMSRARSFNFISAN